MSLFGRMLFILSIILLIAVPATGRNLIHLYQDPKTGGIYLEQDGVKVILVPGQEQRVPDERPGAYLLPPLRESQASNNALEVDCGWENVMIWSGDGNKDTEEFMIKNHWRIRWSVERLIPELSPRLSILVKSQYDQILSFPVSTEIPSLGVTDPLEAGVYALTILSTGRWTVSIEENN